MSIKGITVGKVLVARAVDIASEFYVSLTVDRSAKSVQCIASASGGMEIEEVAARTPERIFKEAVDPAAGFSPYQARNLAFGIGLGLAGASGSLISFIFTFYPAKHVAWIGLIMSLVVLGGMGSLLGALACLVMPACKQAADHRGMRVVRPPGPGAWRPRCLLCLAKDHCAS